MRDFFKSLMASCLGVVLAVFVLIFIGSILIGKSVNSAMDSKKNVSANSVLELNFKNDLPEKTDNVEASFSLKDSKTIGLQDMIETIRKAKEDSNIKGIFLDLSDCNVSFTKASELRKTLIDFKSGGKFITSYSKYYSQKSYYLASVANKIYMHPVGGMDFRGIAVQIPFMKDLLGRLDVNMQIYYAGQFKSATESLRLDKMSPQNRLQTHEYIDGIYNHLLQDISESRKISVADLKNMANTFALQTADDAIRLKMGDAIGYRDEVLADLRNSLGIGSTESINTVSIGDYFESKEEKTDFAIKNKIAVVYAEGNIEEGKKTNGTIGGDKYAEIIRKIREEGDIKAIVLRINSGGGSSMASENIWREVVLAREKGIKVVVSMGDYAASGGYYIACAADSIVAEPTTLTGSIGVFGIMPSFENTMKNKVGVTFDTVRTGQFATSFNAFKNNSAQEGAIIQQNIDRTYEIFLKRVADGRHITRDQVHAIAQGRVWLGEKAIKIGLVDKLGNLEDAVKIAANLIGADKYRWKEYPVKQEKFQQILNKLKGEDEEDESGVKAEFFRSQLGEFKPVFDQISLIKSMKGPQVRLPFLINY